MTLLRAAAALSALVLMAGCGGRPTESAIVDKINDELGKKIVADWRAVPGVADATYEYRKAIDRQAISVRAALKPETASDSLVQELVEIVKRDYWQSTANVVFSSSMFRSETMPETPVKDESIILFNGPIKIDMYDKAQVAELNEKYGPKPERK
ncbi:hypothetical protein ACFOWZ_12200 [Lentzea rhizosphaerae]|uniref:Lipoprotein n=1 Tax=Lentzea rhizosphaerae TaxID=2041025 RepID=A0ABV8BRC3_9PSEU